eukprot:FR739797.1.p1 GENE.FR739797.1~~FR739797.1.p1  ORF type:complete len:129 (+),score=8.27 FR739797.1:33-389(+)
MNSFDVMSRSQKSGLASLGHELFNNAMHGKHVPTGKAKELKDFLEQLDIRGAKQKEYLSVLLFIGVTVPADLLKDDVEHSDLTAAGINRTDARLMIMKARHRVEGARLENAGIRLQAG